VSLAFPKPEKRKTTKGRRDRQEAARVQLVRAVCIERDGDCRLHQVGLGECWGESTWAHLAQWRRSATRGRPVEERHCTQGTMQLCTRHHARYDNTLSPRIVAEHGPEGADGPMVFRSGATTYRERRQRQETA
jgi:hypothetical protein